MPPTARAETLVDFPILVRLDASRIDYDITGRDGADLRFVADDHATLLAHEIERWDPTGESILWVRLPSFGASRTTFWLYYGGEPASAPPDPTATWSGSFVAVWHLGGDLADSSGNGHDGTPSGQVAPASGKVGGARLFDGTDDFVGLAASAALDTVFVGGGTISVWMNASSSGEMQRGRILDRTTDASFTGGWAMLMSDTETPGSVGFAYGFTTNVGWWTTPDGSVTYGEWQHVAATFAESSPPPAIYLNGQPQTLVVADAPSGPPPAVASIPARIGNRSGALDRDFAGALDELRVAGAIRSEAWLAAEVASAEDVLIQFGAEESH